MYRCAQMRAAFPVLERSRHGWLAHGLQAPLSYTARSRPEDGGSNMRSSLARVDEHVNEYIDMAQGRLVSRAWSNILFIWSTSMSTRKTLIEE